jgi:hypothetical protein
MATFGRELPKEVLQPHDSYKCWAAALESWLDVTPNSSGTAYVKTMQDAIALFAPKSGPLGGLDIKTEFEFMAEMIDMDYASFPRHKMHLLTGGFLYSKLKHKGHLYIVVSGGTVTSSVELAHAGVIWAMANWGGSKPVLAVMDPIYGYVPDRPLSYYRSAANAILGWPY